MEIRNTSERIALVHMDHRWHPQASADRSTAFQHVGLELFNW